MQGKKRLYNGNSDGTLPGGSAPMYLRDYLMYTVNFINYLKVNPIVQESWLSTLPASAMQQQRLRVCEVCAAYLGLYDNDQRCSRLNDLMIIYMHLINPYFDKFFS